MKTFLRILMLVLTGSMVCSAAASKPGWTDDYEKAATEAGSSGKLLLLDFTGSDWCPWCIKLDKEVLSKPKFKEWAKTNLVLVEIDFPNAKYQTNKVKAQNERLKNQYKVSGFPTLVILSSDGKLKKIIGGFQEGGPDALLEQLQKIKGS